MRAFSGTRWGSTRSTWLPEWPCSSGCSGWPGGGGCWCRWGNEAQQASENLKITDLHPLPCAKASSCCRDDLPFDALGVFDLSHPQVIRRLQVQPRARVAAEVARQPNGRVKLGSEYFLDLCECPPTRNSTLSYPNFCSSAPAGITTISQYACLTPSEVNPQ